MKEATAMQRFDNSFKEGRSAEDEFIFLRGSNIERKATRSEDMTQHWDVLDKELGRIDIKAAKRKYRGGPIDYGIHWWEFKNVAGKKGWGEPNGVERLIAFRTEDSFVLVDPSKVNDKLLEKCTEHYRGEWGLNTRPNRKDLAAMIPASFLIENAEHILEIKMDERGKKFAKYGWTLSEANLSTLPETAPTGGKRLAEWLTLEGRRSSLVEWLGHCGDDSRIHGSFAHIGAWTGRMSHRNPNQANIPAEFHGEPKTEVEKVKAKYDGQFRALWCVPTFSYLVGTDAEGIQLRVLAHLMRSEEYVHAIVSGKKEDETDIHNLNRKALGMSHITRDMAKTFIYAFLLGAGNAKIAQILKVNQREAGQAVENFMESIQGLSKLKKQRIPEIASRGWFKGLDGRKVKVPNAHKTLAGMLQNGESVIMKHAALQWVHRAKRQWINFKLVTWPHDEWQTEVTGTMRDAELLGEIQRQSIVDTGKNFNMICPLAGSTDIGKNWRDTH